GADELSRPRRDRVRLAVEPRRRDRFEAPLVGDRAAPEVVLAREVAQDPVDRGRRGLAVQADRGEGPDVAVEVPPRLGLLVRGDEQGRRTLGGHDRDPEPADLDPVAGREQDVLGEPEHHRIRALLAERVLELRDPIYAGTPSSTRRTPATTSSTCGSTS